MKLHLSTNLRAALLACVCGGATLAGQATAETTYVPVAKDDDGNITDTNLKDYEGVKLEETADYQKLWMSSNNEIWVADGVEATAILESNKGFTKTGAGTLIQNAPTAYRPADVEIREGTLVANYATFKSGFVGGSATVAAGATLKLAAKDALGYSGGTNDYTDSITLQGSESAKATMVVDNHQTLSTNLILKGYAEIKNGTSSEKKDLEAFGGSITATGVDNVISTQVKVRKNLNVAVTAADDTLTISSDIDYNSDAADPNPTLTKAGDGTLTVSGNLANNFATVVNGGTLVLSKQDGSYDNTITVNAGATLQFTAKDDSNTIAVTLQGGEGKLATMKADAYQVMHDTITLGGYAQITGTDTDHGIINEANRIVATGTSNTIASTVSVRKADVTVEVTGKSDALTITGPIKYNQHGNKAAAGDSQAELIKTGAGTLTMAGSTAVSQDVDIKVNEGVMDVTTSAANGFTQGEVSVAGGGTLKVSDASALGSDVDAVNLAGSEGNTANLALNQWMPLGTTLNLNGHTNVSGGGTYNMNTNGGSIHVTGTDNTIAADIVVRKETVVNVSGVNDVLTFKGSIKDAGTDLADADSDTFTKQGAGTLIFGSGSSVDEGLTLNVESGVLDLSDTTKELSFNSLVLAKGTTLVLGTASETTPITLTSSLVFGENVTIDLSDWTGIDPTGETTLFKMDDTAQEWTDSVLVNVKYSDGSILQKELVWTNGAIGMVPGGNIPEPATTTLSLLALAGLCARRRRK